MIQNHLLVEEPGNGIPPNISGVSESNLPGDTLGIEYRIYGKNTRKSQEELLKKQTKNNNWGNYRLIDTDTGNRIFLQFKSIITGEGVSGKGLMSQGEKRLMTLENGISIRLQLHAFGNRDELQVPKPGTNPAVWDKSYQDEAISADISMEDDLNEDEVDNNEIEDEVDNEIEDEVDNDEIEDGGDNDEDEVDNDEIEDGGDNDEDEMDSDEDEIDNDDMESDEAEVENGSDEPSSSSIEYSSSELLKSSTDDSGFSDDGTL